MTKIDILDILCSTHIFTKTRRISFDFIKGNSSACMRDEYQGEHTIEHTL